MLLDQFPDVAARFTAAVQALTADQYVRLAYVTTILPGNPAPSGWRPTISGHLAACQQVMRAQGEMTDTDGTNRWDLSQPLRLVEVSHALRGDLTTMLDGRAHPGWYASYATLVRDAVREVVWPTAGALTVRHLIGTEPGWDQAAYDAITGPWRRIVGPVHPDDAPYAEVAVPGSSTA